MKRIIISEKEAQIIADAFFDAAGRKLQGQVVFFNKTLFKKYKIIDKNGEEVKQHLTIEEFLERLREDII